MKIHFVCTGNFYRSRLAEAYFRSKDIPGLDVSSSGILSKEKYFDNGPISWYAMRLIHNYRLIPFMKTLPTQTTPAMLNEQDLVIFMTPTHYTYAQENLGFTGSNFKIWNIADLDGFKHHEESERDNERIEVTEKTFAEIREKVDELSMQISQK